MRYLMLILTHYPTQTRWHFLMRYQKRCLTQIHSHYQKPIRWRLEKMNRLR
jgi:hypothetical protein